MILTISGLYGSGGHELAYALGNELGFSVYGKELIAQSVKDSGIDLHDSVLEYYDESGEKFGKPEHPTFTKALLALEMDVLPIAAGRADDVTESTHSGLLSRFLDTMPLSYRETRNGITEKEVIRKLIKSQSDVVKSAAENGDCIFLGRCASHILADRDDCIRIFTCASMESCKKRISEHYGDGDDVEELIKMTNRRRSLYFETFTDLIWDDLENYDYCINTDALGFDSTLQVLKKLVELKK